jgi:hypothetical protein
MMACGACFSKCFSRNDISGEQRDVPTTKMMSHWALAIDAQFSFT